MNGRAFHSEGPLAGRVGEVLLRIETGKSVRTQERPARADEIGILKLSAVTWGEFRSWENKAILEGYVPGDCPRPMDGDLLISRANTRELVGAPVMVRGNHPQLLLSDKILRLVPNLDRIEPRYLVRALRSATARAHFQSRAGGTSGSMTNITQEDIRSTPIPLVALPEQRRIADILDRADALRAKRRAALAQLDTLAQSIFVELFGDPRSNAKKWPLAALSHLGRVKTGGTPPSAKGGMFGGPIPFITPGDLESDEEVRRTVTEQGAAEAETVRAGSTLVCCIGATIGKMGKAASRSAFNQQINAVEWGSDVNDQYGLAALRFLKTTIASLGASTTLPILKKSSFEKLEIPVAPMGLQKTFAERVGCVEKLTFAQRRSLAELDALFASLQHRAFRGEL